MNRRYYALIFLWIGCILGTLAVLPHAATIANYPLVSYTKVFQLLSQSAVLYGIVVVLGYIFATRVGFHVFLFDRPGVHLANELLIAVATGTLLGCVFLLFDVAVFKSLFLDAPYASFFKSLLYPLLGSIYGAFNEEILSRLFILPLCIFILMKALETESATMLIYLSIVLTSLILGILHLPTFAHVAPVNPITILRVILLNTVAGMLFGWLFWKKGIESAIVAHFATDVVIYVLPRLLLIF
jgi:CAAX prenyl protease-like protein